MLLETHEALLSPNWIGMAIALTLGLFFFLGFAGHPGVPVADHVGVCGFFVTRHDLLRWLTEG